MLLQAKGGYIIALEQKGADMPITVLLADDSDVVRRAVRSLIEGEPSVKLIAEAENFSRVIDLAKTLRPHVVVMDVRMPDRDMFQPSDIKSALHPAKVVAISMWDDEETQTFAERCGANKLLDKMKLSQELIPTITQLTSEQRNGIPSKSNKPQVSAAG